MSTTVNLSDRSEHSVVTSSSGSEVKGDDYTSSSGTSSRVTDDNNDAFKDQISRKESQAVLRLRILVIIVLLGAAAGVSIVVYYVTMRAQQEEYRIQYEGVSEKVLQSFSDVIFQMGAISGLAVAASAQSVDYNSEWPFLTLSNFQQRAGNARTLSQALYVSLNPIVTEENRAKWEEYVLSNSNNYWM